MNSYFSTLLASLLEMQSDILDTLVQWHTVSTEYTVLRENHAVIGLEVHIQYLIAEQKGSDSVAGSKKDVRSAFEIPKND